MEQQFKYIHAGKEVSKEEFTAITKDMFKWFENNTINAVDYSSVSNFFGENYKSKSEINNHLKGILEDFYTSSDSVNIKDPRQCKFDDLIDKKENSNVYFDNLQDDAAKDINALQNKFKKDIDNSILRKNFLLTLSDLKEEHNQLIKKCLVNLPKGNKEDEERYLKGKTLPELKKIIQCRKEYKNLVLKETVDSSMKQKFEKIGEKYNKLKVPLDILQTRQVNEQGKKENEGKLHYELSWEFIEEMAKRMANNKSDKYPLYNWKKNIDAQDLKDAINRHHIEVMKGNYSDGEEVLGHIVSYACNSMMLWEQLKK